MASGAVKGITIEIEGKTSGLTKALKEVDSSINKTSRALKDIDKALELDPTNVELLAKKDELLAQKTDLVKERLDILKQVQKDALDKLPQDSAETTAKMATLEAEIAIANKEVESLGKESNETANEVEDLGKESKTSGEKAKQSGKDFEKMGQMVSTAAKAVAAATAAIGAAMVGATKKLADCTVEAANFADEIITASTVTGIAAEDLQSYKYAVDLLDVSLETLTGAMSKNLSSMSSAAGGSKSMTEAYKNLGVSVTNADGSLRDSQEVFFETIDALGQITNETERDAKAMQIFGKSAQDLNPLIEAGSQTLNDYAKEAHDMGYVMSGDTLEAFGEFDNTMRRLELGTTAAKNALGTVLLPILNDLGGEGVSLLGQFSSALQDTDGDIGAMAEVVSDMMPEILSVIQTYLPQVLALASSILTVLIEGIVSSLPTLVPIASDIILTLVDALIDVLPELIPVAIDTIFTLVDALLEPDTLSALLDAAVQIIISLADGISKNMPRLIPKAYEAIMTISSELIKNLPDIIEAGIKIIGAVVSGIIQSTPLIVAQGPNLLKAMLDALADIPGKVTEAASGWGKDMIDEFVEGIQKNVGKLKKKVEDVAGLISKYLHFSVPDEGPLSDFDESGGDMVDVFSEGIEKNLGTLKRTLTDFGNVVVNGTTKDYSGQLGAISTQLGSMGGNVVIPVSIGGQKLETLVVNAINKSNYRGGGRA